MFQKLTISSKMSKTLFSLRFPFYSETNLRKTHSLDVRSCEIWLVVSCQILFHSRHFDVCHGMKCKHATNKMSNVSSSCRWPSKHSTTWKNPVIHVVNSTCVRTSAMIQSIQWEAIHYDSVCILTDKGIITTAILHMSEPEQMFFFCHAAFQHYSVCTVPCYLSVAVRRLCVCTSRFH